MEKRKGAALATNKRKLPDNFKTIESFQHKKAKQLLYKWLVEAERNKEQGQLCQYKAMTSTFFEGAWYDKNEIIAWRKSAGVHMELPFYENSSLWYFDYEERNTGKILFIPDIVIFHQGAPHIIFEIVHKHGISQAKSQKMREYFKDHNIDIQVIKAEFIMSQIRKPKRLITTPFKLVA